MNWISCHSKFEGNCSVCSQKIPVDELIEWDSESSLIRHQHCAKEVQIKNLIEKSQELQEQGKQKTLINPGETPHRVSTYKVAKPTKLHDFIV